MSLFSELDSPGPPCSPSLETKEHEPLYYQTAVAISFLNKCIAELSETPYSQNRAHAKSYLVKKITESMERMVILGEPIDDETEMVQQLKVKFQSTTKRSEQLQVLTVLPKIWSVKNSAGVWCLNLYRK